MRLCAVFEVGSFDNGVDWASFLTIAAEYTLGHVDIVADCPPRAIAAFLRLDCDGLRGTDGLAQLAGDAALLPRRISPKSVLAAESR